MNELLWFCIGWVLGAMTVAGAVSLYYGTRPTPRRWNDDEPGGGWER